MGIKAIHRQIILPYSTPPTLNKLSSMEIFRGDKDDPQTDISALLDLHITEWVQLVDGTCSLPPFQNSKFRLLPT